MNPKTLLGAIAIAILFFFGVIFALASDFYPTALVVSAMMFLVGFGIMYFVTREQRRLVQRIELSGKMTATPLKCPSCSAPVETNKISIKSGVAYGTCPYCGQTFEVTEEPKW